MSTILNWLNANPGPTQMIAGGLQFLASLILVIVTWRYVTLTRQMSTAAWESHKREVTPNVILQSPLGTNEYYSSVRKGPLQDHPSAFRLTNLSSGTILIEQGTSIGWVGSTQHKAHWADIRRMTIDSGGSLALSGLHTVFYLQSFSVDEFGQPRSDTEPFDRMELSIKFFHGPSGNKLFTARFGVDLQSTPPVITKLE